MTTSTPPGALPASKEAEAEPAMYVSPGQFENRASFTSNYMPFRLKAEGKFTMPLYAHPPTDAGVSEVLAAQALQKVFAIRAEGTSQNPGGYGAPYGPPFFIIDTSSAEPEVNWPGELIEQVDDVGEVGKRLRAAQVSALRAALSTAIPAGDGVPPGMVLVPIEPTREMWAAMADTLYGYKNRHHDKVVSDLWKAMRSTASTAGKG